MISLISRKQLVCSMLIVLVLLGVTGFFLYRQGEFGETGDGIKTVGFVVYSGDEAVETQELRTFGALSEEAQKTGVCIDDFQNCKNSCLDGPLSSICRERCSDIYVDCYSNE